MCGITGYIGYKIAYPIILNGLKRLEYRGYDSAGIVLNENGTFKLRKTKGSVSDLIAKCKDLNSEATVGIGHTRWATHGVPSDINAHPHISNNGKIAIIHNGIIENYGTLKIMLTSKGYTFKSETDTEVLVNLIQYMQDSQKLDLSTAVRYALNEVVGAYSIAVMEVDQPQEIVVARLSSPLAIGIGENEYFIASDASPFIEFTNEVVYLEDGEMATITLKGIDN